MDYFQSQGQLKLDSVVIDLEKEGINPSEASTWTEDKDERVIDILHNHIRSLHI